jgi:hypothetical protein
MPLQPLNYSGPYTNLGRYVSISRSILVGIICWCAIALAMTLFFLAGHWEGDTFFAVMTGIFILIVETILAVYGLIASLIDWHLVRPVWRGMIGVMLNLMALLPMVVFFVLLLVRR